jgi:signal transduction histidine kinase
VFINVINNALYWLIPSADRRLHIAYEDGRILIINSGAKIESADLENIFTLFFTRKPGGRGIGLYLAKTNLHTIGYDIYTTNDKKLNVLNGACFVIETINKEVNRNEL